MLWCWWYCWYWFDLGMVIHCKYTYYDYNGFWWTIIIHLYDTDFGSWLQLAGIVVMLWLDLKGYISSTHVQCRAPGELWAMFLIVTWSSSEMLSCWRMWLEIFMKDYTVYSAILGYLEILLSTWWNPTVFLFSLGSVSAGTRSGAIWCNRPSIYARRDWCLWGVHVSLACWRQDEKTFAAQKLTAKARLENSCSFGLAKFQGRTGCSLGTVG